MKNNFHLIPSPLLRPSSLFSIIFKIDLFMNYETFFGPRIFLYLNKNYSSEIFAIYKKFLFNLFALSRKKYSESAWYICAFRHIGAAAWEQNINFISIFFPGFIFQTSFPLSGQIISIGYYLYFYGKLLEPYFSCKKIYTINWP